MSSGLEQHTDLTHQIIAACYEVHSVLGPGLEERFYRDALCHELKLREISVQTEREYTVVYKGRVDIVVEDKVLIELKAVAGKLQDIHIAQTVSERQVSGLPVALLVNFGDTSVQVRRLERRSQETTRKHPLIP